MYPIYYYNCNTLRAMKNKIYNYLSSLTMPQQENIVGAILVVVVILEILIFI